MWCSSGALHLCVRLFFFFKQKTAYEMRISDWSSDVCSSDLGDSLDPIRIEPQAIEHRVAQPLVAAARHILAVGGDDRGHGGTQGPCGSTQRVRFLGAGLAREEIGRAHV